MAEWGPTCAALTPFVLKKKRPMNPEVRALRVAALVANADDFARSMAPAIHALLAEGLRTPTEITAALNEDGVPSSRGGRWLPTTVRNLLDRLEKLEAP